MRKYRCGENGTAHRSLCAVAHRGVDSLFGGDRFRTAIQTVEHRSEISDGMRVEWNVPITMDDGVILRADIFRPIAEGNYPVILSYGPYAKALAFQDGYPNQWQRMIERH